MTDPDFEHDFDDEPEQPTHADAYQRIGGAVTLADRVDDLAAAELPERDDAWWNAQDAKVAQERELAAATTRFEARKKRASLLKSDEYRFPAIAVDAALAEWPQPTMAMANVRKYLAGEQRVLVLAGGVGAGKSTAATWCALEVGGSAPAFLRVSELEGRGRYDRDLRDWLRTRSMLVLDDLGAEVLDGKGNFRSLLDEVVDMYYGDRKRLVVTTNLRPRAAAGQEPQLAERYGERVASRFAAVGLWADCGVKDLRREVPGGDVRGVR